MGGMLALEVRRQAAQRARGPALPGTTARADTPTLRRLRGDAIGGFAQGDMDEALRANVMFAFHPRHAADAAMIGAYLANVRRAGADRLIAQNRAVMVRADLRGELAAVGCPTLMMVGEADVLTPPGRAREIAGAMPWATLEILPDCGPLLTWVQPARVNDALLRWLARLSP